MGTTSGRLAISTACGIDSPVVTPTNPVGCQHSELHANMQGLGAMSQDQVSGPEKDQEPTEVGPTDGTLGIWEWFRRSLREGAISPPLQISARTALIGVAVAIVLVLAGAAVFGIPPPFPTRSAQPGRAYEGWTAALALATLTAAVLAVIVAAPSFLNWIGQRLQSYGAVVLFELADDRGSIPHPVDGLASISQRISSFGRSSVMLGLPSSTRTSTFSFQQDVKSRFSMVNKSITIVASCQLPAISLGRAGGQAILTNGCTRSPI